MTVPQPPSGSHDGASQGPVPYRQPAQQYGQGYPGMYAPPPRGLSIASMVIGIVSLLFLCFTIVVPLVGLILGVAGLRREPAGRGFALAGIWINAVILAISVIIVVIFIGGFLAFGAATLPFFFIDPSNSTGIAS